MLMHIKIKFREKQDVSFPTDLSLVFPSRINTFICGFIQVSQETKLVVEKNIFFLLFDCPPSVMSINFKHLKLIVSQLLYFTSWHGRFTKQRENHRMFLENHSRNSEYI